MQLTLPKTDLLHHLGAVGAVVHKRHTMPVLSCVLIERTNNYLSFTGSNLEIQIRSRTVSEGRNGGFAVDAKRLSDIVKALPQSDVHLSAEDGRLTVKSGRSHHRLDCLPASDFPLIAASENSTSIRIRQTDLQTLIRRTLYAAPTNDIRYFLNGLLLEASGRQVRSVCTDGHRLVTDTAASCNEITQGQSAILPRKAAEELGRLAEGETELLLTERHLTAVSGDTEICCLLIDGKFPDWQCVLPDGSGRKAEFDRLAILEALERATALSDHKKPGITAGFSDGLCRLTACGSDFDSEDSAEIRYQDEPLSIGFNANYLKQALQHIPSETVTACLNKPDQPVLFLADNAPDFRAVVMPMRL